MRIAAFISHPIQYYAPIFRELARRVDLHVFYGRHASTSQQASAGFGVEFEWDVDLRSGYNHTFFDDEGSEERRPRKQHSAHPALREGRFDAVLAIGWYQRFLLDAIFAAKRIGLPLLVRGDSQLGMPRSSLKRAAQEICYPSFLRLFDAALYVGEQSKAYLRHYRYPSTRLFHSPHCIDTVWFSELAAAPARSELRTRLGIGDSTAAVLFAGKLVPFKRPIDFVEAVSHLRARGIDAHAIVAGSGELEGAVQDEATRLGVPLSMLGFQNQTQMPRAYAAADVLVLPSTGLETWGLVCNEAIACGTPVVVSDAVGCAPDIAADGKVGRTFSTGDSKSCADAIAALLASPPSPSEISSVSARFTIDAAVSGIVDALCAVVDGKQAAKAQSPHTEVE